MPSATFGGLCTGMRGLLQGYAAPVTMETDVNKVGRYIYLLKVKMFNC